MVFGLPEAGAGLVFCCAKVKGAVTAWAHYQLSHPAQTIAARMASTAGANTYSGEAGGAEAAMIGGSFALVGEPWVPLESFVSGVGSAWAAEAVPQLFSRSRPRDARTPQISGFALASSPLTFVVAYDPQTTIQELTAMAPDLEFEMFGLSYAELLGSYFERAIDRWYSDGKAKGPKEIQDEGVEVGIDVLQRRLRRVEEEQKLQQTVLKGIGQALRQEVRDVLRDELQAARSRAHVAALETPTKRPTSASSHQQSSGQSSSPMSQQRGPSSSYVRGSPDSGRRKRRQFVSTEAVQTRTGYLNEDDAVAALACFKQTIAWSRLPKSFSASLITSEINKSLTGDSVSTTMMGVIIRKDPSFVNSTSNKRLWEKNSA